MRAAAKLALGLVVVAALLLACNTPTIPIPPLGAPSFESPAPGTWVASGSEAPPAADVVLINQVTGDGVVTRVDRAGAWMTPSFAGTEGNTIELFYRTAGELSAEVCSTLAAGTPPLIPCP